MWKVFSAAFAQLLAIILIIVFCGHITTPSDVGYKDKFDGELERNVKIKILENDTAKEQGYLTQLLTAFNAEYKSYGIEAVDANTDENSDLEKDGPYGYGPDVLYQANDQLMKYVNGKHIMPLPVSRLDCYSQIDENAWGAYAKDIEHQQFHFGVPVNIQGPLLYYRKDLLPVDWETKWDENGNKIPDMLESWNAMYSFSYERKEASAETKYGYMKSLYDVYFSSGYLFSYGGYVFGDKGNDAKDIGLAKGNAEYGARVIKQLASVMNEECIDNTITLNAYSKLANGSYFATMTTPDVYTLFIRELALQYRREGLTKPQAEIKAIENLGVADIPQLPVSGNLEERNPELMPSIMMGGINGYAISSYTKSPNASLAFVDFATKYEMLKIRNQLLGIVPARSDLADDIGGLTKIINKNLEEGRIAVMPSVRAVAQVWSPTETFFADVAKDAFRRKDIQKYNTLEQFKIGLQNVSKQVYDAIWTLN